MIEPQRKETAAERIQRCDAELAKWRAAGSAYVVLCPDGAARAAKPGKLLGLLNYVQRHPGTVLLELCDQRSVEIFKHWALFTAPATKRKVN